MSPAYGFDDDGEREHDCCPRCGSGSCPGSGSRGEDACTDHLRHPCGHRRRTAGCGGCDPGAIEFVIDDAGRVTRCVWPDRPPAPPLSHAEREVVARFGGAPDPFAAEIAAVDLELSWVHERAGAPRPTKLGCSTVSHDRLGFCSACTRAVRDGGANGARLEVMGWRLLALRVAAGGDA